MLLTTARAMTAAASMLSCRAHFYGAARIYSCPPVLGAPLTCSTTTTTTTTTTALHVSKRGYARKSDRHDSNAEDTSNTFFDVQDVNADRLTNFYWDIRSDDTDEDQRSDGNPFFDVTWNMNEGGCDDAMHLGKDDIDLLMREFLK